MALTESVLLSNLDETAERYGIEKHTMSPIGAKESAYDFKAGAKWMAEQGVTFEDTVINDEYLGYTLADKIWEEATLIGKFEDGDKVIVQIRKK